MQTRVHNFEMEGVWNNKQIIKYTKKRLIYINSLNIHHNFGRNKMWPKIQDANKAETSKRVSNLSSAQLQRKGKLKSDLEFVKKFTRPNFWAKEFYTLKTRKSRLFSPAINSENASLSVIWASFG